MKQQPKLSLGPILYYWSKEDTLAFYQRIAESPVDIVYIGETICSKRNLMRSEEWLEVGEMLSAAGKEVVLSTLALLEAESELKRLRRLCDNGRFMVEANDMGAVQLMGGRPFVAGHSINIYNHRTLSLLAEQGLCRWVFPVELSHETLAQIQSLRPQGVETEVLAFGRLPLAYSARCFTARAYRLPKDDCQYRCLDHPDGMTLSAQDGTRFLTLNGIQTQSARCNNLLPEINRMVQLGVDVIRISPQSRMTERVIELFSSCLRGEMTVEAANQALQPLMPGDACDGYWYGEAGMDLQAVARALT